MITDIANAATGEEHSKYLKLRNFCKHQNEYIDRCTIPTCTHTDSIYFDNKIEQKKKKKRKSTKTGAPLPK